MDNFGIAFFGMLIATATKPDSLLTIYQNFHMLLFLYSIYLFSSKIHLIQFLLFEEIRIDSKLKPNIFGFVVSTPINSFNFVFSLFI